MGELNGLIQTFGLIAVVGVGVLILVDVFVGVRWLAQWIRMMRRR